MATAIAPAPTTMTLERYLHTSFSPDVDFVNGEIQERNVGEKDHGRLQLIIAAWFLEQEATLSLEAIPEQRMLVTSDRARICDVAVIPTDVLDEQVPTIPPFICIDIMSPEDRMSRAVKVLEDYRAMGVPNIWLIDPQERLVFTFGPNGLEQQQDLVLHASSGQIAMNVNEMFIKLDKKKNIEKA